MDIPRQTAPKKRRRIIVGGALVAGLALVTLALSRLPQAAPTVEKATVWTDSVRRGTMVRQVRAPGTLVPEQIQIVSAVTAGRVERIALRPGEQVSAGSVLLELSNPDVQLESLESERQLAAAEAQAASLRMQLETGRLAQQGTLASVRSEYEEARRVEQITAALDAKGMATPMEMQRARDRATELSTRLAAEEGRLKIMGSSVREQLALQERQVERLRAIAQFQKDRIASMRVAAGAPGVLQQLPLELGQWVTPGQELARVAQPGRLKAVLRVPETQAKDVVLGQPVSIDTRNGTVNGKVMRVDPAVQGGTVTVEVALVGELPRGARPDLSVDGTIEVERLTDVLYVGRPAYGQPESMVGLFRLDPDGVTARRVNVKLGRSSVNTIEVVQGLNPGDRVIISDMSQWENADRVKLK
ncbi:MAG: efflux RND transporter periplasmic adaptor subunit [Gemmatimonadaceae bacterium]